MGYRFSDKSRRMPEWDYSGRGIYFITIVTQNRECNLGEIKDGKMFLSDFGKIVKEQFLLSFEIRKELYLDEYVIMPNHIHAIIVLKNTGIVGIHGPKNNVGTHGRASLLDNGHSSLPENNNESLRDHKSNSPMPQRKPRSISSFVAGFKAGVNEAIDDFIDENKLNIPKFTRDNHFFQPNYNDHVIRNKEEYYKIKNYIITNPKKWNEDELF
ncbi:MAG: hypothetical protein GXO47_00445 [Chlorobi bacterium]|nr:hypothetical protein [Chlorobiota bacterium]